MITVTDTDVLIQVGNTSLVKLDSLSHNNIEYFAKLEGNNPFGSVKDGETLKNLQSQTCF